MNQGLSAYCQKYGLIFHDYKGYYRDVKDMINYQLKLENIWNGCICHLDLRQTFIKGKIFLMTFLLSQPFNLRNVPAKLNQDSLFYQMPDIHLMATKDRMPKDVQLFCQYDHIIWLY